MNIKSKHCSFLAGLLIGAAGIVTSHAANSTLITFSVDMSTNIVNSTFTNGVDTVSVRGTFNGWAATGVNLVQEGLSNVYTNTVNDTSDTNGTQVDYIFLIDGSTYESVVNGNNRAAALPATSGASLVLPTPFFSDAGAPVTNSVLFRVDMSQQIALGNFTVGTSTVEVQGSFEGWTSGKTLTLDPSVIVTNEFGLTSTNVYDALLPVATSPAGMAQYKYVIQPNGNYESPNATNGILINGTSAGNNRFFANVPQTLPLVAFSDQGYAPIVSNISFSVDMSIVVLTDTNYNPASVTFWGQLSGWGGVAMTNNPSAANTNIYTTTQSFAAGVGSQQQYQFRYTELSSGTTVYDHLNGANGGQGNRIYTVANVPSTNILSTFNDATPSAYLFNNTPVFFSIDMSGAVDVNGHVFNPSADNVYVNGEFANWYAWAGGANPSPAPPGYQMVEVGTSTIYTNTIIFPGGTPVDFTYKYGLDINAANGGPDDDEAGFALNHGRVVRSLAQSPYVLATDKFGNQYNEPFFDSAVPSGGNLAVGGISGGKVLVQWLGCPGARLATSSSLNGPWQQHLETDGTNWSAGILSTNGLLSQTNWPTTGGNLYFRLIKPN